MSSKTNTLNIGLVLDTTLDTQDGVPQYVIGVGEWLKSKGHEVSYIVGESHRTDLTGIISVTKNITVSFNGNRISTPLPASGAKLNEVISHGHYDILHIQAPYSPMMAHRLIRKAPKSTAIIGTFHILPTGALAAWGTKMLSYLVASSRKRFDTVFSVTTAAQQFAKKSFGLTSIVVPNVFDYALFHEAKPLDRYTTEVPIILFFGRLVPRKGCAIFLQAMLALKQQNPNLSFKAVIGGAGALQAELEQFVADNGMQEYVVFEGFVSIEEKPRLYASSQITIFPSYGGESFGIVLLEAMASGTACVLAGNNPGYSSVMEPKPELIFDTDNVQGLVNTVRRLLLNDSERANFAAWGAEYTKQYDVAVVGERIVAEYNQALRNKQ